MILRCSEALISQTSIKNEVEHGVELLPLPSSSASKNVHK